MSAATSIGRRGSGKPNLPAYAQQRHTDCCLIGACAGTTGRILTDAGRVNAVCRPVLRTDDFKEVNEQFSYHSGDSLLVAGSRPGCAANSGAAG